MSRILSLFCLLILLGCQPKPTPKQEVKTVVKEPVAATKKLSMIEQKVVEQGLIDIQEVDATLWVDLKYATTDNFFGENVYGDFTTAYLQKEPAEALKKAHDLLKKQYPTYRLLVYDAVRPRSVQYILWEKLDSIPPKLRTNYVADPVKGSIHNYGCAVDLTIYDTEAKQPLDMGTPFDYFGYLAYPRKENELLANGSLTEQQVNHRKILRQVMQAAGYEPITSEWWHFNYHSRKVANRKYKIVE